MSTAAINLLNLKGKVHPDVEKALWDLSARLDQANNNLSQLAAQLAQMPTGDQMKSHAAMIDRAVATVTSMDTVLPGISTGHKQQASILPTVVGSFAFTSNGSSITWYWDGTNGSSLLTILWPDGSITSVPPASLAVTGLAASTAYTFYAYYDVNLGMVLFAQNSAASGTPPAAFTTASKIGQAIASADTHVSMSDTTLTAATTSGGAGGGSGGGSGGRCVEKTSEIVPLSGDFFSYCTPETFWIELETLNGHLLRSSTGHRIFTEFGCAQVERININDRAVTREGLSTITKVRQIQQEGEKRLVWVPQGHLYWANGILCHNKA